jgi:hypothetical protein
MRSPRHRTTRFATGHSPERTVPVTAVLSKSFYEKFGEDITNELVNWFNIVDATYKADLRELNETNFARFDAKLGQLLAELKTDLLKWMFAFWVSALLGLGALFFRR